MWTFVISNLCPSVTSPGDGWFFWASTEISWKYLYVTRNGQHLREQFNVQAEFFGWFFSCGLGIISTCCGCSFSLSLLQKYFQTESSIWNAKATFTQVGRYGVYFSMLLSECWWSSNGFPQSCLGAYENVFHHGSLGKQSRSSSTEEAIFVNKTPLRVPCH